jgi:RimJ/RimL family protein N-acetyltransferase
MNIHRIQINAIEMNDRAVNLYERAGAVKEGRLREAFYYQNKYHDILIYSILKDEYFSRLQNK